MCMITNKKIGNYYAQIVGALNSAGQPVDDGHINQSDFYCEGGSNGNIKFQGYCGGGCVNGGDGASDHC
jgi:hypothetical protein